MSNGQSSWPSVCLGSERKVRHTTQIQVRTGILAVMIRKERQSQEMTVFCLQGTVFMGGKREIRSRRRVQSEATPPPQSALQKPQKRSIKTKDAYLKIQADPAPATLPSALQQGKASFVQERQGTLLRSGKLDRRLPAGEDVPSAAPPSGKRPQGMDIHKQPRQVSGQAGGSRVQSKPHRETPRQAMGGTAKTAVKERGAPVKQAAHPVRKTAGLGSESQVGNHRQGHSRSARPAVQQRREPGWHELRKQQKRPV